MDTIVNRKELAKSLKKLVKQAKITQKDLSNYLGDSGQVATGKAAELAGAIEILQDWLKNVDY